MRTRKYNIVVVVLAIVAKIVSIIRDINGTNKTITMHISRENKKLVPNKETAFIIWNIPAVFTCPFATDSCIESCYARKAERAYPNVLPARTENYLMSKRADFSELMTAEILKIAKGTKKTKIIVRIHESGDFYNQKYTDKWIQVMENCLCDSRIQFIAYTKSFKFFDGKKLPDNFSLRASVWNDTDKNQHNLIKKNHFNVYTAVPKFSDNDNFHQCRCKDCATCAECWNKNTPLICCEIH